MKNMERIKIKPIVKTFRKGKRKPSIKITVSADIPEILNASPELPSSPEAVIKRIVNYTNAGTVGVKRDDDEESFTRITVDDSVVDFPNNCIDFGINDFLCYKDEIDLELSSDTDASFLEATPPHRFSDSELESQFEIMSITLDSRLKLGSNRSSFASPFSSKDDSFTFDFLRLENGEGNEIEFKVCPKHNYSDDEDGKIRLGRNGELANGRPAPPRPFRRNISLPASIFMSYLMAEQVYKNKDKRTSLNTSMERTPSFTRNERFGSRKLTKIDGSYSSNESTEAEESSPNEDGILHCQNIDHHLYHTDSSSEMASESGDSRDTPMSGSNRGQEEFGGSMFNCGSTDDDNEQCCDDDVQEEDQAFTSEIEKKSLVLRYMRKLIRQDTSGNFAPPDYCI